MTIFLIGAAVAIILGLSAYALHLVLALKKVKAEQQAAQALAEQKLRDQQLKLIEDIRFVSRAMLADQCDITEGVLRLHFLVNSLDPHSWADNALQTLRDVHDKAKTMPILDAYKALSKQQQYTLDKERLSMEQEYKEDVYKALNWLVQHPFPSVTLIH